MTSYAAHLYDESTSRAGDIPRIRARLLHVIVKYWDFFFRGKTDLQLS